MAKMDFAIMDWCIDYNNSHPTIRVCEDIEFKYLDPGLCYDASWTYLLYILTLLGPVVLDYSLKLRI